jgi:hypothetical protein
MKIGAFHAPSYENVLMRRIVIPLLGPACALILMVVCFHAVLFGGEQFAYRDAGHFYYPLYLRIQQEWAAGRWPLWDPWQNAGMPLLGMPMSAVFYPGKLLYAIFAYPWATRLYTVAHVAIAWAGMFALAHAWGQSTVAAGLAAMAYAFGAPVLFQHCNVIYLVGAAWVPWGFLALEWMFHQRRRWGMLGLALVLALQVLGGDPEAAYLTVLCGGGYALVLAAPESAWPARVGRVLGKPWVWGLVILVWVGAVVLAAYAVPKVSAPSWLPRRSIVRAVVGGSLGLWILSRWRHPGSGARLGPRLTALAESCALAALLAAVQLLPILEYTGTTARAADDRPGRIYGFCVEPWRMVELVWPNVYGRFGPENRSWVHAIPPRGERQVWTPSLYVGGLTLVLALSVFGFRGSPPWRRWLSLVALVAVTASFGRFGGPLWLVRWLPGAAAVLGPHDPLRSVDRIDAFLDDGAGSVYGLLATLLPGFNLFRYPGKLSIFATVALAALAGDGWDRLATGRSGAPRHGSRAALALTLVALGFALAARGPIVEWLSRRTPPDIEFGPVDPRRAFDATVGALVHGGVVFALAWGLAVLVPRRPGWAGAGALLVMVLDLGMANASLVWTVPQAEFARPSRAFEEIATAEQADPSPGPFRVHRMGTSYPDGFARRESPGRLREAVGWERDTLQPLYALPQGLEYTLVQGIIESEDYALFFGSRLVTPRDASGSVTGSPVYSFPRRSFDLWNSRYFLMPIAPEGWLGEERDFERLYPPAWVVQDAQRAKSWIERENWQLLRNKTAFPRAWLVHFLRVREPITSPRGAELSQLMDDLIYQSDAFWHDPNRGTYDLRSMAFVETDQPQGLAGYVARTAVGPAESIAITRYEPQRVELVASLQHPGLVILADTYYPGWKLTIDGLPAPIYRTNRLMRGAAVKAGRHILVYTYDPDSFRIGGALSVVGVIALTALVPWARAVRGD